MSRPSGLLPPPPFFLALALATILAPTTRPRGKTPGEAAPGRDHRPGHLARRRLHEGAQRPEGARATWPASGSWRRYPGGSPDIASSRDRVAGFTKQLRDKFGVEIVDSIDELLEKVDVVLLESVDGRPAPGAGRAGLQGQQAGLHRQAGRRLAGRRDRDLRARRGDGTPCFSSSSLRFSPAIAAMKDDPKVGDVLGCDAYGPCSLEEHHPDLFWYGVHGVEIAVHRHGDRLRVGHAGPDRGDRAGRPASGKGAGSARSAASARARPTTGRLVFGTKGIAPSGGYGGYEPLVVEICKFFRTGKPPVRAEETIEIFAFMEAADESKRQGGKPVTIESVMAKAHEEAGRPAR